MKLTATRSRLVRSPHALVSVRMRPRAIVKKRDTRRRAELLTDFLMSTLRAIRVCLQRPGPQPCPVVRVLLLDSVSKVPVSQTRMTPGELLSRIKPS